MALRPSLAKRRLPSTTFPLRIEDDTVARAGLAAAEGSGDPERIAVAEATVGACYEQLKLTSLPPETWEELVSEHPATEAQQKSGQWCNMNTFLPALLAACVEGDETAEDWANYTQRGALSSGEADALFAAVIGINQRTPEPLVPKGSTQTRS